MRKNALVNHAVACALACAFAGAAHADDPSLVDRTVAKALLDDGRAAEAKAVLPTLKIPAAKSTAKPADPSGDLARAEGLLAKKNEKDAKAALVAFKRALAKAPKSATPLWGISRAADASGDKITGKRYALLYVKSDAADKDAETINAARWRSEQPDDTPPTATPPPATTTTTPGGIPTSAAPSTTTPPPPM